MLEFTPGELKIIHEALGEHQGVLMKDALDNADDNAYIQEVSHDQSTVFMASLKTRIMLKRLGIEIK